jgi:hypothetical protein
VRRAVAAGPGPGDAVTRALVVVAALVGLVLGVGACTRTFSGRLRTRDPLQEKKLEAYRSGTIVLGIGDIDVVGVDGRPLGLAQSAWFEIVSKDEIRFHVLLSHKWEELSQVRDYRVRLRTDGGDDLAPTDVWTRRTLLEVHQNTLGQIRQGPTANSGPSLSEETFQRDLHGAGAVIVFRHRDLVRKEVRSYTLVLEGNKRRLRFIWDLVPPAELGEEE